MTEATLGSILPLPPYVSFVSPCCAWISIFSLFPDWTITFKKRWPSFFLVSKERKTLVFLRVNFALSQSILSTAILFFHSLANRQWEMHKTLPSSDFLISQRDARLYYLDLFSGNRVKYLHLHSHIKFNLQSRVFGCSNENIFV